MQQSFPQHLQNKENMLNNSSVNKSTCFKSIADLFDQKCPSTNKKSTKKVKNNEPSPNLLEKSSISQKITIKDLCPEEKQKIGDLIQKLAKEKQEKDELIKKFEQEKSELKNSILNLTKNHEVLFLMKK